MSETTAMNEVSKRKPGLSEHNSVRVTFADGQAWWIPKPWLEIRQVFKDGEVPRNYRAFSYGQPINSLIEMLAGLDGFDEVASATATLAEHLLRLQYNLEDDEFDQLLAFRVDDVESIGWMKIVVEVATGCHGRRRVEEVIHAG